MYNIHVHVPSCTICTVRVYRHTIEHVYIYTCIVYTCMYMHIHADGGKCLQVLCTYD